MNELDLIKINIEENEDVRSYYIGDSVVFEIKKGFFGYKEFFFKSNTTTFFSDSTKTDPVIVYTNKSKKESVGNVKFENMFPLAITNEPEILMPSSWSFKLSWFSLVTHVTCYKEGKKIFTLKRDTRLLFSENIHFQGNSSENDLELFVSLLYVFLYPGLIPSGN